MPDRLSSTDMSFLSAERSQTPAHSGTLQVLRQWWKTHRNRRWIFPAPGRDGKQAATATQPVSETTVCASVISPSA